MSNLIMLGVGGKNYIVVGCKQQLEQLYSLLIDNDKPDVLLKIC